ncbi:hypothetical protein LUZ16_29210 [Streptomyces albireticuli]|uniref:hypothetical protein n=1 Tax=Streptomyces albireticuli TaxID=1940 RepID=UPI001E39C1B5|nr:hypothetical protein [Streptomyces albireticuli]MCD9146067.1 hypothetical protein [Streptomyces albireticuli]
MTTAVENIQVAEITPSTRIVYRGVSPAEFIYLEGNKFSRAQSPTQGNDDPQWKALYTGSDANVSSRNITDNPGGVVKIEYPSDWKVLEITSTTPSQKWHNDMGEAWPVWRAVKKWAASNQVDLPDVTASNIDDYLLLDELGKKKIILKKPIGEDDVSSHEFIIPWKMAETVAQNKIDSTSDPAAKFFTPDDLDSTTKQPKDQAAVRRILKKWDAYSCKGGASATFGVASLCGINVAAYKADIEKLIKDVYEDPNFSDLKNRTGGPQKDKDTLKGYYERLKPKVETLRPLKAGVSSAVGAAGAISWAIGVADAFTSENVSSFDKAAAVTAIVPGLGECVGIANAIDKRDPEGLIINTISMAALMASAAVPVLAPIGVALDAGLAAAQGVATVLEYLEIGQPARTPLLVSSPKTHKGVTAAWVGSERIIAHRPRPGMRQHIFSVSIDSSKPEYTAPLIEVAGVRADGKLDPSPEWIRIRQNHYPIPFRFEKLSGDSPYAFRCVLLRPTTITRTEPVYVTFAYMTSDMTCRTGESDPNKACSPNNPAIAVRFGSLVKNEDERSVLAVTWPGPSIRPETNWIKLPYSIHPY